jgi:hypothetical protein
MSKPKPRLPLTPAVFHILLALVGLATHNSNAMSEFNIDGHF